MVPRDTSNLVCTPFIVLPALPYRVHEVPFGNLEGLPGITMAWDLVPKKTRNVWLLPLSQWTTRAVNGQLSQEVEQALGSCESLK